MLTFNRICTAVAIVTLGFSGVEFRSVEAQEIIYASPTRLPPALHPPPIQYAASMDAYSHGSFSSPAIRPNDQIWLVSSRRLCSTRSDVNSLEVKQYLGDQWFDSTTQSLTDRSPDGIPRRVVILVHGNSWSYDKAVRRGLQTYKRVILPWAEAGPIRLVIWTWPSDKIRGPIRNVTVKAPIADQHSFHFAKFLQQLKTHRQVAIIGYSYGSRVTLGALHLLGNGSVLGRRLDDATDPTQRINLALIAPAIRNDVLLTSRARAFGQINHLFVMYNSRDRYLKLYRFLRFDNNEPALGFTGVAGLRCLPNYVERIDQFDAAEVVGPEHDFLEYITEKNVEQRLRRNLFFPDLQ